MNDEERHQLHELLETTRKRLRALEQKAATYGINTPAEVQVEIDDLRTEIAGIEARLAADAALRLPAPVADFVGRADEIARLVAALGAAGHGTTAAISGVRGLGGLGKTQLALAVARRLAAAFPDGQFMLALRGATASPMTPALALQTVIRAYERTARLPDDLAQLQALYQALLSGKRLLILADDAQDAAQVRPLLPPPGCALLITSRRRFSLPGMAALDLGVLPEGEAIQLLCSICQRIDGPAAALAKLCGYLPLALRVSAGVLANDDTLSVARYLERLEGERLAVLRDPDADPNDPEANIEASLRLSYDALDAAAQGVLCQLSVFAASFDLAAAEAVVSLPSHITTVALPSPVATIVALPSPVATGEGSGVRDHLGLLRRRCLLEWEPEHERYRLHELLRAFGIAQLADAEAVWMRYAQYYAKVARHVDKLYLQGGEQMLAGLALFDTERAHIDAGWGWARERAGDAATDELLLDYPNALFAMANLRYDARHERIPQLEAQLAAARRIGRRVDEGYALGNLGNAYAHLGEPRRAIEYHEQALMINRAISDRRSESAVLGNLGLAYADLGEPRQAIDYYEQQLAIARDIGDRRVEGSALNNLGLAYADLGEPRRAIELYEQRLVIARAIGDQRGEGNTLGNLGNAYADLGEPQRAIDYYEQSLAIKRTIGDRRGEANSLHNLGNAYADQGEPQRAIDYYEQSLAIKRTIGDRRGEANALYNTALALNTLGDRAQAIIHAEAALPIYEQIESPVAEGVRRKLAEWHGGSNVE